MCHRFLIRAGNRPHSGHARPFASPPPEPSSFPGLRPAGEAMARVGRARAWGQRAFQEAWACSRLSTHVYKHAEHTSIHTSARACVCINMCTPLCAHPRTRSILRARSHCKCVRACTRMHLTHTLSMLPAYMQTRTPTQHCVHTFAHPHGECVHTRRCAVKGQVSLSSPPALTLVPGDLEADMNKPGAPGAGQA